MGSVENISRHYNWLIFRLLVPALEDCLEKYAHGRLLDIGCGKKPYADLTAQYVSTHVGLDYEDSPHGTSSIDLFGTAYEIPVEDADFDTVLCTDVLEHLEDPNAALAETYRVLQHGGHAIYSVPLFWHLHEEPRDFYRFTKYGLQYLFEKAGLEIVEIRALSGFCVTFGQELTYFLQRFRRGGKLNPLWWVIPPLGMVIQLVAFLLGKVDHSDSFSIEYVIVARKPQTIIEN